MGGIIQCTIHPPGMTDLYTCGDLHTRLSNTCMSFMLSSDPLLCVMFLARNVPRPAPAAVELRCCGSCSTASFWGFYLKQHPMFYELDGSDKALHVLLLHLYNLSFIAVHNRREAPGLTASAGNLMPVRPFGHSSLLHLQYDSVSSHLHAKPSIFRILGSRSVEQINEQRVQQSCYKSQCEQYYVTFTLHECCVGLYCVCRLVYSFLFAHLCPCNAKRNSPYAPKYLFRILL